MRKQITWELNELKFDATQIEDIKRATGSLRKIASRFGVVHATIRGIKNS